MHSEFMRSDHSTNNMIGLKTFLSVKIKKGSFAQQDTNTYVQTAADL
jgi:hypothetical protein